MELTKVNIARMSDGSIVKQSENSPEWGFVRVEQENISIVNNWLRRSKRSALINGLYRDLLALNLSEGTTFPGKLVVDESLEPFNPGPYQDRDIKHAFEGGPICVYEDMPIYRRTRHTYNMDEQDTLIPHTNVEEIKQATAKRREMIAQIKENEENVSLEPTTVKQKEVENSI
jgi:hypothetical protein